jgi:hypothetical protein
MIHYATIIKSHSTTLHVYFCATKKNIAAKASTVSGWSKHFMLQHDDLVQDFDFMFRRLFVFLFLYWSFISKIYTY